MAWGVVAKMLEHVYEACDDCMGSILDAEVLAGWVGEVGRLTRALNQAGFIRVIEGHVFMVEAISTMSPTTKKRWQRCGIFSKAAQRAAHLDPPKSGNTIEVGLFGITTKQEETHERSEHTQLVNYWSELWSGAHGGRKYPFRPKDAAAVAAIRRFAGSYSDACNVLESYVTERGEYFKGHDLQKCVQQLARFIAKSQPRAVQKGEYHKPRSSIAIDPTSTSGAEAFERRIARIESERRKNNGALGGGPMP